MQNLWSKLSPLFFLLLLFSCTKDNEFHPLETTAESSELTEAQKSHKPCKVLCKKPSTFTITDVDGCSATLNWTYSSKVCGYFTIQLKNIDTGETTLFNTTSSPFTLSNLDPCTKYTVGISHITDLCASLPIKLSFKTDCKGCKNDCGIKCKDPDYATVSEVTSTSAIVKFGFTKKTCGYFIVSLKNNATNSTTYFNSAASPLLLTNLEPCTSYTVGISHITDLCAKLPTTLSFTTECGEYCDASGINASCLNFVHFWFDSNDPGFHDLVLQDHPENTKGYIDSTNFEFNFSPGAEVEYFASAICGCDAIETAIYVKLWIDFDQDYEFESSELVLDQSITTFDDTICLSYSLPGFNIPNIEACGLRGRCIISDDPNTGPCGTFAVGQAVDFTINTASGCGGGI